MSAILKFDFQRRKQLRFFWSKLSKLHNKDPIFHMTTTFSLKQWETRTNSVPIPQPLTQKRIARRHFLTKLDTYQNFSKTL